MSKFVIAFEDPATSYQLSLTEAQLPHRDHLVTPYVTPAAQEILDQYTYGVGPIEPTGYTCAVHKTNGLDGSIYALLGSKPTYTRGTQLSTSLVKVAAKTKQTLRGGVPGSYGASTPSVSDALQVGSTFVGALSTALSAGSIINPALRIPAAGSGVLAATLAGIALLCETLENGSYSRTPKDGLTVVVYAPTDGFATANFNNPSFSSVDNSSTIIGMVNTINNIKNTNITNAPTGNRKGLLDIIEGASRYLMSFAENGGGSLATALIDAIAAARSDATGAAFNTLMDTLNPILEAIMADLFDYANRDKTPATTGFEIFNEGSLNTFTSIADNIFKLSTTGATVTEVLVNNPWPYQVDWPTEVL